MKKRRGRWCRLCGRYRPNEAFSGRGHRDHICRECGRMPAAELNAIEQEREIFGFLEQSHISANNEARLSSLCRSDNRRIADLAQIVLEVARVKPHKRRRIKFLARTHPELLRQLAETGLIAAAPQWDERVPPGEDTEAALARGCLALGTEGDDRYSDLSWGSIDWREYDAFSGEPIELPEQEDPGTYSTDGPG